MNYKNRIIFLVSLIAVLACTYVTNIILGMNLFGAGSSFYVWLDSRTAQRATRIIIKTPDNEFELAKKTNQWFVLHNNLEYPARQSRIDDFLSILSTRAQWPVRSTSESTHERFGLDTPVTRISIFAEYTPLFDLLIGNDDIFRNETYFRRYGQNEVRSGDGSIRMYLSGPVTSWYNLRLFPESEGGNMDINSIQRFTAYNGEETQIFSRRNRGWEISGVEVENPSVNNIENYIRAVINLEGDNFDDSVTRDDPMLNHSRITVEFGNGRTVTIRLSDADETGRRLAHASGREYVYSIPSWSAGRIFRPASSFESSL
jgi:hypothetical protein